MQTTGIFTTHRYEIKDLKINEPIYLIPFGDVHRSAPLCHVEKWKEFLSWAKTKERCYFLGMGDYDDLASTSERKKLGDPEFHESTQKTIEQLYQSLTKRFADEVSFMKGRCIGLIEGNHYGQFLNGTTTTQKLAEYLGCKYLGVSSFIRLSLSTRSGHGTAIAMDIWAHHGQGASRLLGGSLNRVQQMAEAAEADIYLMGHDHKKSAASTTRLHLKLGRGFRLAHRKMLLCRTGSFLRGYVDGQASYIADKAMSPTDLGVVKIELTPKRKTNEGEDYDYVDLHASI